MLLSKQAEKTPPTLCHDIGNLVQMGLCLIWWVELNSKMGTVSLSLSNRAHKIRQKKTNTLEGIQGCMHRTQGELEHHNISYSVISYMIHTDHWQTTTAF